ncbi:hypothetical protein D3C78_1753640 [compost metagenome]
MRNGNPFQPEEVAGIFGEPVPQLVDEGGMHHHAQHTQPVGTGGQMHHGAGKGHVPDVPDIDVHHSRHAGH